MKRMWIVLAFLVTLPGVGTAAAQRLIWLGTLSGGGNSEAVGVSADGRFVVGTVTDADGRMHAVRWQIDWSAERWDWVTIEDLGTADGLHSTAADVSADGSVVVGTVAYPDESARAFRWHAATREMKVLGTLGGPSSTARAVSADGRFVVGWAENSEGHRRPFRYDAMTGEMQDLGTLGGPGGWAEDVSGNGRFVIGVAKDSSDKGRTVRWDLATNEIKSLRIGEASGISDNGRFVIGNVLHIKVIDTSPPTFIETKYPIIWDASFNQVDSLEGSHEGYWYEPQDISSDGFIVVGRVRVPPAYIEGFAVRWKAWRGLEDLNEIYADLLSNSSKLHSAAAISPDGRYIVGQGYNAATGRNEAYLLDTGISTAVEEAAPVAMRLVSLWPNPFREAAHMRFQVAVPGRVRLVVYDLLGRSVRTLLEGPLAPGTHEVVWDGRSDTGVWLPAGLYLLRLEANGQTQTRTITIVR